MWLESLCSKHTHKSLYGRILVKHYMMPIQKLFIKKLFSLSQLTSKKINHFYEGKKFSLRQT